MKHETQLKSSNWCCKLINMPGARSLIVLRVRANPTLDAKYQARIEAFGHILV